MRSTRLLLTFAGLAALLAIAQGCSSHHTSVAKAPLTERQRDSVIATENLPGAAVVGRALQESDRQARRAVRMDSLTR